MLEYAGDELVSAGKLFTMPQTSSSLEATCITVVNNGLRTTPTEGYGVSSGSFNA